MKKYTTGKTARRDYIDLVYMGLDHIFLDSHAQYKNRMSKYNLIPGRVYNVHCMGDMRWIGSSVPSPPEQPMREIDKDLVDRFFKPLSEIRDEKIDEIINNIANTKIVLNNKKNKYGKQIRKD